MKTWSAGNKLAGHPRSLGGQQGGWQVGKGRRGEAELLLIPLNRNKLIFFLMSDSNKRNSTRERKLPVFLRNSDIEYGINTPLRATEPKEAAQPPQEQAQVAKLLTKLVSSINKRSREYQLTDLHEASLSHLHHPANSQNAKPQRRNDRRPRSDSIDQITPNPALKANQHRDPNQDQRKAVSKGQDRTGSTKPSKNTYSLDGGRFIDQNVPEHMRGQLGMGGTSHQDKKADKSDGRPVGISNKSKKHFNPIEIRPYRQKSDLKLFKRQSYHVAIAYHIHLRAKVTVPTDQRDIDPTFHARKLREQQGFKD